MDSGNSGSMQSSSGGDDDYDSRTETISSFLNPSVSLGSISSHPQPPPPPSHHQTYPPTLFDSRAHNLGAFSHSPANPNANTLYNLDVVWSRSGLKSPDEPNYTDLGNLTGLSSLSSSSQSFLGVQGPSQGPFPSSSSMPLSSVDGNGGRATPRSDQTKVVKNSKKRTRASRRAPTTVLTTDTSNFRQRVQEFTGIPGPPFSGSPYNSRRLDLFGAGSGLRSGHLETLGPLYHFRPSVQKVQPSPFVSSSSSASPSLYNSAMIDTTAPTSNIDSTTNNNTITASVAGPNTFSSTSSGFQMPSDSDLLPKQPHTMLNMQNQILPFQSLLQSSLKYPASNAPVFSSKPRGSSAIPSLDPELCMTREHMNANLGEFQSHGFSHGRQVRSNNNLSRWRAEEASNERGQEHLGSFDRNNGEESQYVTSYKLNCAASTSDLHPEKGLPNVSSMNEGTVDSWICPSD